MEPAHRAVDRGEINSIEASELPDEFGVFKEDETCSAPVPDDAVLWRYVDFPKYVALLEYQALAFARTDTLRDPFEGSATMAAGIRNASTTHPNGASGTEHSMWMPGQVFVSCWNLSPVESSALWSLYGDGGVAICTTAKRLRDSFAGAGPATNVERSWIRIGAVKYIDYATDDWPDGSGYRPFFHKQLSFRHEQEVRALVSFAPRRVLSSAIQAAVRAGRDGDAVSQPPWLDPPVSRPIRVDLDTLIDAVFVSPVAPKWFGELVHDVSKRYGLRAEPQKSPLAKPPWW